MGLKKWIDFFKCGKRCYDIITDRIPPRLEDGTLTVDEMATIIKEVCAVFGIEAEIKVPKSYVDTYFDIIGYDGKLKSSH